MAKYRSSLALADVAQPCSHCLLALGAHESRLIGAAVLKQDRLDRFNELMSAIRNHEWTRIRTFQTWEGSQPNAEVYAINCPDDRKLSLVVISAPFSLDEPYILMHQEAVDDRSSIGADQNWDSYV